MKRSILDCIPQYRNSTLQSLYAHMIGICPGFFLHSSIQLSVRGPLPVLIDLYSLGSSSVLYSLGGKGSLTMSMGSDSERQKIKDLIFMINNQHICKKVAVDLAYENENSVQLIY